jgi:cytochrome c553
MKKTILTIAIISACMAIMLSCGDDKKAENAEKIASEQAVVADVAVPTNSYDPKRGEGKFDSTNVTIGALDEKLAKKGEEIAGTKCNSCHKMTDEKLVGPGWKGVTARHTPYWIMNFISNPDPMIDKDPEVQSQLEICLVRMPNQGLTDVDAREIVEFMRKNDGAK